MKRTITFLLAAVMCIAFTAAASADDNAEAVESARSEFVHAIVEEQALRSARADAETEKQAETRRLIQNACRKGVLTFDPSGYLVLDLSLADEDILPYADTLRELTPIVNLNLHWGTLVWDSETETFQSPEITEEFMAERLNMVLTEDQNENPFLTSLQ